MHVDLCAADTAGRPPQAFRNEKVMGLGSSKTRPGIASPDSAARVTGHSCGRVLRQVGLRRNQSIWGVSSTLAVQRTACEAVTDRVGTCTRAR
jgi:hypothetical protein